MRRFFTFFTFFWSLAQKTRRHFPGSVPKATHQIRKPGYVCLFVPEERHIVSQVLGAYRHSCSRQNTQREAQPKEARQANGSPGQGSRTSKHKPWPKKPDKQTQALAQEAGRANASMLGKLLLRMHTFLQQKTQKCTLRCSDAQRTVALTLPFACDKNVVAVWGVPRYQLKLVLAAAIRFLTFFLSEIAGHSFASFFNRCTRS